MCVSICDRFNRKTAVKETGGRTEEKEIKGWINSPTAASCSSSFWNICHREQKETERRWRKKLQSRWRGTREMAGNCREKHCMNHYFLWCVLSTCVRFEQNKCNQVHAGVHALVYSHAQNLTNTWPPWQISASWSVRDHVCELCRGVLSDNTFSCWS